MGKPKIRFKGYNDEWEQRKLGDILISLQNNTLSRADLSNETGVAKNVHYGDVLIKFGEVLDVSKEKLPMISDESVLLKYKASFLKNGDVIVADTAEDTTVGKCSEIAGLDDEIVLSGLHTIPYRPVEKFASGYLGYYLNSSAYHNQLIPLMQGIKVTSVSKSAMQSTNIIYPKSKEEQAKIGSYFQSLDRLITLHQRKCDEMKTLKKYMLQKMFPQNGQKIPEIRFEGFTGEWEQRKCKDIFDRVSKAVDVEAGEVYREIGIRSHGKGLFYKDEITGEGLGNKRVFWVEPNSFILNIVFAWERAVTKTTEKELGMIASHRFPMYKPKENVADLDYITKFFITHKGKYILEMASPGGAGRNKTLGQKEFENSTICLPSYEEQKKIGRYLEVFDHLITLHQRKCDKLKSIKKFMLQNMFV